MRCRFGAVSCNFAAQLQVYCTLHSSAIPIPTFEKMKIAVQHYAVPADLKPYIDSFWQVQSNGNPSEVSAPQYCLATGLVELIVHTTPPFTHTGSIAGRTVHFPEAFIGGMHVEPVLFQMRGNTGMFGISCKPEAFVTLFDLPVGELVDDYAELRDFFGKYINDLVEQIQTAPSSEHRVQIAVDFFRQRAAMQARRDRLYFSEAMHYIRMESGQQSVDDICGKVFVGKRQLQRIFQENIGISPKLYGRIVRFKGAYDYVQRHPRTTWTEISHHFGYSDQSHFIRDFREFTGENPGAFLSLYAPRESTPLALTS